MGLLRKFITTLSKQQNVPPHLGAVINVYQTTAILYAPLTLIGVVTTVYGLWGSTLLREYLPWFTVWHLVGCMVLFILMMMVVFYKVIIPSIVAFNMQQAYKHRNPIAADLQNILKNQKELFKEIHNVSERLSRLESLPK